MKYLIIFSSFFLFFSCVNTNKISTDLNYNSWSTTINPNKSINNTNSWSIVVSENNIDDDIEKLNNLIKDWKFDDAEKKALALYQDNKESIPLLNILWNIYNWKLEPLKAIDYLEKANKLTNGKDWYILFNIGVSYSTLDKEKAKKYLNDAKVILPNDENLTNFITNLK